MKTEKKQSWWLVIFVGGIIPLTLILGSAYNLADRVVIPIVIIALFLFGSMWMWMHANATAKGDEWWQDDHTSGWRGY